MKKQAFNPYLPSYEYIPDGEPYVFDGRVYVYGSHDCFNGTEFCVNDYVCWSAPTDDLGNWRYEGIIYKRTQDPLNSDKKQYLYAPDVQKGADGRYYLYYSLNHTSATCVAVCDTPAGQYEYYGIVKYPDGTTAGLKDDDVLHFDPAVLLDDDGKVYLYTGFSPKVSDRKFFGRENLNMDGSFVMELEHDMLTVKQKPKMVIPSDSLSDGTGFEGHEFFEASSIRKIGNKYYFVYSSLNYHELCYAISDRPDGGFKFGGTLVSIGDIFLNGRDKPLNYLGNTHGGMVLVNGQWYIFYHRQTNRHGFSRQGCAEPINIEVDGSIKQAEITSCGLNGGALNGKGEYMARTACNLMSKSGAGFYNNSEGYNLHPYFTQELADGNQTESQYIANIRDGSKVGYKYFLFDGASSITVKVRGKANGTLLVSTSFELESTSAAIEILLDNSIEWQEFTSPLNIASGKQALYFSFSGEGYFDFLSYQLY